MSASSGSSPADSPAQTTPPTSPPSEDMADAEYDPVSENMRAEEERMRAQARRDEAEDKKRSREWASAGRGQQSGQFNKLMHLVEQSKVRPRTCIDGSKVGS